MAFLHGHQVSLTLNLVSGAASSKTLKCENPCSGGERSYTTVAFLLAIGQWTESPFRCMDEFDVFMDPINRRVATETLLQFA